MSLAEKIPVNWALLRNPANWVIVWLMIALAIMCLAYIVKPSNNVSEE